MVAFKRILLAAIALTLGNIALAQPYSSILCQDSNFTCYISKRGDTWEKLFSNMQERYLIKKINRVNIPIYPGMKIAIPKSSDRDLLDYSPFPTKIAAPGEKMIYVSLKALAWGAYEANGQLINWGPASGGQGYCSDIGRGCNTATGKFAVYRKEGEKCYSKKYPVGRGGAPMPYCMFFNGGFALHGSYIVPGYNASHGCVRLFIDDAQWLNEEFIGSDRGIPVIVKSN